MKKPASILKHDRVWMLLEKEEPITEAHEWPGVVEKGGRSGGGHGRVEGHKAW
jgi:hypothetical protein